MFKETDIRKDNTQDECPDSTVDRGQLTENNGKPGDETEFGQHENRCIKFLRHFRNQRFPFAVISNGRHADVGIAFNFFRCEDDFPAAELFEQAAAFSLKADSGKRIAGKTLDAVHGDGKDGCRHEAGFGSGHLHDRSSNDTTSKRRQTSDDKSTVHKE